MFFGIEKTITRYKMIVIQRDGWARAGKIVELEGSAPLSLPGFVAVPGSNIWTCKQYISFYIADS